jgi:hypothetical protein
MHDNIGDSSPFESFIQGGFECSTQRLRNGKRLDLIASTHHDQFVREDYARLKAFGIRTVREGLRWHRIEATRGVLNFDSLRPMIAAANEAGMQVIWDLFHFGWPDHLDIFHPDWVEAFGELAAGFTRVWTEESGHARAFVAPMNEISFVSWAGGDRSYLNPCAQSRGGELKKQLVRGGLKAIPILRGELSDVLIVSPEPVIHIAGDPDKPGDVESAEAYRLSMFEAWDMLTGRLHPELGGHADGFDILGINYYDRNQWWNYGPTVRVGEPAYRPFHHIVREVYERYRRPMFIAETGSENEYRVEWFAYIAGEIRKARNLDIPVHGICLYPILNHSGWDDDRYCRNGLWDYAGPDGSREIYRPLADEIYRQEEIRLQQDAGKFNEYP